MNAWEVLTSAILSSLKADALRVCLHGYVSSNFEGLAGGAKGKHWSTIFKQITSENMQVDNTFMSELSRHESIVRVVYPYKNDNAYSAIVCGYLMQMVSYYHQELARSGKGHRNKKATTHCAPLCTLISMLPQS